MKKCFSFKKEHLIECIFLGLILLRGGYFYYESMIFGILAILFFLGKEKLGNWKFPYQRQELFLPFLFYFVYGMVFFWSGKMHLYGFAKMLAPFLLAVSLLYLEKPSILLQKALRAYVYSLTIAFGLIVLQNLLKYLGVSYQYIPFFNMPFIIQSRFTGFIQYANTNALLSLLSGIVSIFVFKKRIPAVICGLSLGLSGSRTAWVLTIVALLVIPAAEVFLAKKEWKESKKTVIPALAGFILSFMGGVLVVSGFLAANRMTDGFQASELQTRFLYYEDGIRMILQNPLGVGHYGYHIIQRQYQTGSTYYLKHIHNILLQIALDGGWLSLIVFMMLLIKSILFPLWRQWKTANRPDPQRLLILWLVLLALGHSLLEFHFEFSYVVLLFWIFYFENAKQGDRALKQSFLLFKKGLCLVGLSFFLCLGGLSVMTLYTSAKLPAELGFVDAQKKVLKSQDRPFGLKIAHKMEKQRLKNPETFAFLRDYYYNKGEFEKAIDYAQKAVELAPLWMVHREELMRIQYAYVLKDADKILEVAEDVLFVPEKLKELKEQRQTMRNVRHKPKWEMTDAMKVWYKHIKELYFMLR